MAAPHAPANPSPPSGGILGLIERIGNALPDPVFLFVGAAVLVMVLSAIGSSMGWSVQPVKPVLVSAAAPGATPTPGARPKMELRPNGAPVQVQNLLSADGIYWCMSSMVRNFINFAPLGLVLVSMLGIGVAEKVGYFGAVMTWLGGITPRSLLTPMVMFLGIMSNLASDAGYIVLPPLAAGLYAAMGRSPVAGIATAFAGVAAGFSANLLISAGDALMAGLSTTAAQIVDPKYEVKTTSNWYFLAASTVLLVGVGWLVTALIVEPRASARSPEEGGVDRAKAGAVMQKLSPGESRALALSGVALAVVIAGVLAMIFIPGAPLHDPTPAPGAPPPAERWTLVIVPLIFLLFLTPGVTYGIVTGAIRNATDVAKAFTSAMGSMGPIIVLAFFAAQFIEYFKYSNLDRMLAFTGGSLLVSAGLPPALLIIAVIILTLFVNLFIGSMSAKYALLAPVLVPMLMMVGMSPELTQAAYRVGDSVTNIITPLNSYLLIILVVLQKHWKSAGMGSLIAMMIPYSVIFTIAWTVFLVLWYLLGVPLGAPGPLHYQPSV